MGKTRLFGNLAHIPVFKVVSFDCARGVAGVVEINQSGLLLQFYVQVLNYDHPGHRSKNH